MTRSLPLVGAVLLLVAAACGGTGSGQTASNSPSSSSSKPVWVLGSMRDLTGAGSNAGSSQQAGLDFFVNQTNKAGGVAGHNLELQTCDTQSTPTGGANCARQLTSVDSHVVLLNGALPSTNGAIPQLTTDVVGISVLPVLFPKAGTNVFQISPVENAVVTPMVQAAKSAHLKTIGVIYTADASGTAQLNSVKQVGGAAGLQIVSEAMNPTATDVTTQLLQLKSNGADLIFTASIGTATSTAVTSYHSLNLTMPLVLGAQAVTNSFLKALPFPIPDHMYGISTLAAGNKGLTPAEQTAWTSFRKDFKAFSHQPVDSNVASGYYTACVAAAALKATNGGTGAEMTTYLAGNTVSCLGSEMRFNTPGLNVVTNQPTALVQAGSKASDGWGPVRTPL
ncbi:MAG: ABC transporter substrate-binding protein [Candidatus Dormibacteraeota bacterium]|nr:ABC transporter substrate-binding protein [Candidatus Dormibacteraeota bacterium]